MYALNIVHWVYVSAYIFNSCRLTWGFFA